MRYDPTRQAFIVDDGLALPARYRGDDWDHADHTGEDRSHFRRHASIAFENRWRLSIIWGSMTYGSNHDHPYGDWNGAAAPDFDDDPPLVEVGIMTPTPTIRPAQTFDPLTFGDGQPITMPEMTIELWGEPIGWVDAVGLRCIVAEVSRFDSHTWPSITEGPKLEQVPDQHTYRLTWSSSPTG